MKAVLEVNTTELAKLVRTGLLDQATVLHRADRQRRLLSVSLTRATELQLRDVAVFFAEHGHYAVPRTGRHAALGKWLSKLGESYATGQDLDRVRLVEKLLPGLHVYLTQWAALRKARRPVHAPAWLQGAWAMDFMATSGRAASQASCDAAEVACAKWVTRWAAAGELFAGRETLDQRIGIAVYGLAQRFRFFPTREDALLQARAWKAGSVYDLITEAARAQPTLLHVDLERLIAHRLAFWPTRAAWAAEHATWQDHSDSAVRELASRLQES